MPTAPRRVRALLSRGTWPEATRITALLRQETVGGLLLLGATVLALVAANTGLAGSYRALSELRIGPAALHLDLSVAQWAADGLLAVFFLVAGLELKREFVAGDLRNPRRALVPVAAAVGGMTAPALIFVLCNAGSTDGALAGWAIPTATDIAFALAVLAVIGTHLPAALRTFLLTLAVVDDLLAIVIIAFFYSSQLHLAYLALALLPLCGFGFLVQRRIMTWWLLIPLGIVTWALVHASGIHATVAGVLLGFTVPVLRRDGGRGPGAAQWLEHRLRPVSAGVAVPVFAFFAAGVSFGGWTGLTGALGDRVTLGVLLGLVAGKTIGVLAGTAAARLALRVPLGQGLSWWDLTGLAVLAGIGFTVSLLIGELAFGPGARGDHVKVGVLLGSLLAALVAAVVLRLRNRVYRMLAEQESADLDGDGIPDCYQQED